MEEIDTNISEEDKQKLNKISKAIVIQKKIKLFFMHNIKWSK